MSVQADRLLMSHDQLGRIEKTRERVGGGWRNRRRPIWWHAARGGCRHRHAISGRRCDRLAVDDIDRTDRDRSLARRGSSRSRLLRQRRARREYERERDEGRAHVQSPLRQSADDVAPSRTDERSGDGDEHGSAACGNEAAGRGLPGRDRLRGRLVGRAEPLRRDETDDDGRRGGEPHHRHPIRGRLRTLGSIDDRRKFRCTRVVQVSKIAEPRAKLVVAAHQRVSSTVSSRARAFLPRS